MLYSYSKSQPLQPSLPLHKRILALLPQIPSLPSLPSLPSFSSFSFSMPHLSLPSGSRLLLSRVFLCFGLILIVSVLAPFALWFIRDLPFQSEQEIVKPVPDAVLAYPLEENLENSSGQVAGDQTSLQTDPNSWFVNLPKQNPTNPQIKFYTITIPKLKIADASVEIGGENLGQSLIHYAGTALPGEYGNSVVFGHSTLPQFFNPKQYLSIFSLLPSLKEGAEIFVSFDGVTYKYVVESLKTFDPSDISVLEQRFDDRYLTLVTCVPPGTYWKRLAVKARLVKI